MTTVQFPVPRSLPAPYVITSLGRWGAWMQDLNMPSNPVSATVATNKRAFYVPVYLPINVYVLRLGWLNGAAVAGNIDCGIYSSVAGMPSARLLNTGSTAQAGINTLQTVDTTDTWLTAGTYFLAITGDTSTSTLFATGVGNNFSVGAGMMEQTPVTFGLPATATPVSAASGFRIPLIGMWTRTLV